MKVTKSSHEKGIIGISGHVGAGHVHGHNGFVQDDSAGFCVAAKLISMAYPVDTVINDVRADIHAGLVSVQTHGGGVGTAIARRGISPYEAELVRRCIGRNALFCQTLAFFALGRIYGQGVLEVPVVLQTAAALAVIDTFEKCHPEAFVCGIEDIPGNVGKILGTVVEIDEIPVSVLAVINATEGGIGPVEDLEGNVMIGDKGRLMKRIGLDAVPTIILECKAYVPPISDTLTQETLWIRANGEVDNRMVFDCLVRGAEAVDLPYRQNIEAYPRGKNEMAAATQEFCEKLAGLGRSLSRSRTAAEKARIVAELSVLISEDAGGISFMSNELHDVVGGAGIMPGTSAVLSMLVSKADIDYWKIPVFTDIDAQRYLKVIGGALPLIASEIRCSQGLREDRSNFEESDYNFLMLASKPSNKPR